MTLNVSTCFFRLSIKDIRLVGQVRYEGNIIVGVNIVGIELQNNIGSIEVRIEKNSILIILRN